MRRQLGIKLQGEANMLQLRQALYRCDDLFERIPIGKGRHYHVADAHNSFLIVQDSTRHFTLHAVVDSDDDMKTMFEQTVAMPVKYEMLSCQPWRQNLLLADSYGQGRVFLAGDAVHLVIPTGGLGMNSGVGDAIDLSWKLAATLQGWGGPALLRSYEIERRQIGARNVEASRHASRGRRAWRAAYKPNIRDKTPEGAETRANLARIADVEQRKSNEMIGAELGYRYAGSPIIWPEAGEAPEPDFMKYVPTTWPGARLPHVWLADGTALHDRIGDGYTLLRLARRARRTSAALARAFAAYRAPFSVLAIDDAAPARYLRLRLSAAAAGPARGLARQPAARRSGQAGGAGDGALSVRSSCPAKARDPLSGVGTVLLDRISRCFIRRGNERVKVQMPKKLTLTLACGDYEIVRPLLSGKVEVDGVDLTILTDMDSATRHWRFLNNGEFDIAEVSGSSYLAARDNDLPFRAIPVFLHRRFRHGFMFINTSKGIAKPADLRGRKIGVKTMMTTAVLWMRGILQHEYGVPLNSIEWVAEIEDDVKVASAAGHQIFLPAGR